MGKCVRKPSSGKLKGLKFSTLDLTVASSIESRTEIEGTGWGPGQTAEKDQDLHKQRMSLKK